MYRATLDAALVELRQDLERVADLGAEGRSFEELISEVRSAIYRTGLEALRAATEMLDARVPVVERDGARLRFRGIAPKNWLTPFGVMKVERRIYAGTGTGTFAPLDARCGMEGRYVAPQIEDLVCFAAASSTPVEVEQLLRKALPAAPSATAIKRVIAETSDRLNEHRDAVEAAIADQQPLDAGGGTVVASWDGCMVALRGEKRAAEWKEAGVGRVSVYRTGRQGPEMTDSRCFARMPEPGMHSLVDQVVAAVADLQARGGVHQLAVICDGKPSIWTAAARIPEFAGAIHILDFYHAMEHVTAVAKVICGGNDVAAKRLSDAWREKLQLEHDGVDKIIRSLKYYTSTRQLGTEQRRVLLRARKHFMNNRERMRYADYIGRGLPIGSGPIEAACKTIVQHRLKRSGMTWSRTGGQHVLNLRALVKSGRWDVAWRTLQGITSAQR
jgi:hypothetical protein